MGTVNVQVMECDWSDCGVRGKNLVRRYYIRFPDGASSAVDLCKTHEDEPLSAMRKLVGVSSQARRPRGIHKVKREDIPGLAH